MADKLKLHFLEWKTCSFVRHSGNQILGLRKFKITALFWFSWVTLIKSTGYLNVWVCLLVLIFPPLSSPRSGCKKHLKNKETRHYYFKTICYCSKTKVKSPLILRRFYATWPWTLKFTHLFTLGLLEINITSSLLSLECHQKIHFSFM